MGKYRSNLITAAHIYNHLNPTPELKTVTRKDNRQKLAAADRQCTLGIVVLLPLESLLLYSLSPANKLPVFIDVPQCDLPVGSENEYIVIATFIDGNFRINTFCSQSSCQCFTYLQNIFCQWHFYFKLQPVGR